MNIIIPNNKSEYTKIFDVDDDVADDFIVIVEFDIHIELDIEQQQEQIMNNDVIKYVTLLIVFPIRLMKRFCRFGSLNISL